MAFGWSCPVEDVLLGVGGVLSDGGDIGSRVLMLGIGTPVTFATFSYGFCTRRCLVYVPRFEATIMQVGEVGDLSTRQRLHGRPTSVASHLTFRTLHV
jgi:hypothetical protein